MPERIRVTLRSIQILDKLEPFYKKRGEFRFLARVVVDGHLREVRFPRDGHYEISAHPEWNRLKLDRVLYEGPTPQAMTIELSGEELDSVTANDPLDQYLRAFQGEASAWLGAYGTSTSDARVDPAQPENMSKWRVAYVIEPA